LNPVVPEARCLKSIKIKSVGQLTVKIEANTDLEIMQKLEDHFFKMDIDTKSVTFKSIFDALNIKKDRLQLYPKLLEIREKIRPDVVVKKK
jgi:spore coat polysaccharide biosynthesis protein SpsF (cytidylyltransferase family)